MSSESRNELSSAVSYYHLYSSLSAEKDSHTLISNSNNLDDNDDDNKRNNKNTSSSSSSSSFWQVDEWSYEDECRAQALLNEHESKCTIPTSRVLYYEREAAKNWNKFYQHHGANFFHDRHYLKKAFPEEFDIERNNNNNSTTTTTRSLVEIGCGVGNNILPLLEQSPQWKVWGYDLSPVAIELMQQDPRFDPARAHGGVWDISQIHSSSGSSSGSGSSGVPPEIAGIANVCTLLFCLSAIAPEKMSIAAQNIYDTLQPGGVLVLRDYGRYDEAQLKLGRSRAKRLGDNFYAKSDGTRCFYFTLQDLEHLFANDGNNNQHAAAAAAPAMGSDSHHSSTINGGVHLEVLELKYIRRVYQNRAKGEKRRRVWVQGRFRKPIEKK